MSWDGREKRQFIRAKFPCKIIIFTPQEYTISTHTENIGAGGMRVFIEERLEIASIVKLEILLNSDSIICEGRVVWVVKKESSYRKGFFFFDTGIEFYKIEDQDRIVIENMVNTITYSSSENEAD